MRWPFYAVTWKNLGIWYRAIDMYRKKIRSGEPSQVGKGLQESMHSMKRRPVSARETLPLLSHHWFSDTTLAKCAYSRFLNGNAYVSSYSKTPSHPSTEFSPVFLTGYSKSIQHHFSRDLHQSRTIPIVFWVGRADLFTYKWIYPKFIHCRNST